MAVLAVAALVVGIVMWAPWVKHPPKTPANVRQGSVTATTVEIRWDAAEKGPKPDTYVINRDGTEIGKVSAAATTYKDDGLRPGNTYKYSVLASTGSRRSGLSKEISATTATPPPTSLAAGTVTINSISFRWAAPADAPAPDEYVILRDGSNIGSVSGTTTSYKDTALSPMTAYEYEVAAVWSGHRSNASDALKVSTAKPSVASARVSGTYDVRIRIKTSGGGDLRPGLAWNDSWSFAPKCSSGPCSVTLEGEISPGGFSSHGFTVTLNRYPGGIYTGTTRAHITHCGVKPLVVDVTNTISVRLKVTGGEMSSDVWTATTMSGSMSMNAPYVSAGAYYCPAQGVSTSLSAS